MKVLVGTFNRDCEVFANFRFELYHHPLHTVRVDTPSPGVIWTKNDVDDCYLRRLCTYKIVFKGSEA